MFIAPPTPPAAVQTAVVASAPAVAVSLRGFRLYWVDGGNTPWPRQRSAWCGVGRRGRASWSLTPRGTFRVVEREDLTRRKADSKYGTRILVLDTRIGAGRRISIHGTNEPLLIGTRVSDGCVRLFNEDIEWLYDRVPVGTTVVIGD